MKKIMNYEVTREISNIFFDKEDKKSCFSYDLRWLLRLQRERMKKNGITKRVDSMAKSSAGTFTGKESTVSENSIYVSKFNSEKLDVTTNYYSGEKNLLTIKNEQISQYFIVDVKSGIDISNEPYVCPNCGNISTVKEIIDNPCPFCRTKFDRDNLFPFVSFIYFFDCIDISETKRKKIGLIFALFFVFWLMFLFISTYQNFEAIVPSLMVAAFGAALLALIFSNILVAIISFKKIGKTAHRGARMIKTKDVVKKKLQPFYPGLNDDKVIGDLMSNFFLVMFSDDFKELSCYDSDVNIAEFFKNTMDSTMQSLLIKRVTEDEKNIQLECVIVTNDVILKHGSLKRKRNDWSVKFEREKSSLEDANNYHPKSTRCAFCGHSFDPHFKHCKHCRKANEARKTDWIIESIERY